MPDRAANEPAELWLPDGHVAFYFSSGSPLVTGVLLRCFPCVKDILGPAVSYRGFRCKPHHTCGVDVSVADMQVGLTVGEAEGICQRNCRGNKRCNDAGKICVKRPLDER